MKKSTGTAPIPIDDVVDNQPFIVRAGSPSALGQQGWATAEIDDQDCIGAR